MRKASRLALVPVCLASAGVFFACAQSADSTFRPSTDDLGAGGAGTGVGGNGSSGSSGVLVIDNPPPIGSDGGFIVPDDDPTNPNITHPTCNVGACTDFPKDPLMGDGVPANAAALFGAADNFGPGTLCVLEPQLSAGDKEGAMIPANWVRPRFRVAAQGLDLFEIRIHSAAEKNDLVAYTKQTTWYLPKDIWAGASNADGGIAAGSGVSNNAAGAPFTVTIRGISSAAPAKPVGIKGDFNIAPVVATGSMVFWTVKSSAVTEDSSKLLGFAVGEEGVAESLKLTDLKWTGQIGEDGSVLRGYYDKPKLAGFVDGQVRCVGCHTSTPDGQAVVFTDDWPWSKASADLTTGNVGAIPSYVSAGAQAIMKMPWWGTQSMSKSHWTAGDRILITSYGYSFKQGSTRSKPWQGLPYYDPNPVGTGSDKVKIHKLAWIDLESKAAINVAVTDNPDYGQALNDRETAGTAAMGTGYGLIATGDTASSEVSPSINHAGDTIVYTATDYAPDGHPDATATTAVIKTVPYNNKAGGTAAPLAGASDANQLQYYPSYSADDQWIAFTRAPKPDAANPDGPYYNRKGEIAIVAAAGGTAMPIAANLPNACAGDDTARGIINSWPKWSPDVVTAHGKVYYFVIFSSARKYGDEFSKQFQLPANPLSSFKGLTDSSQLYLAAIVVDKVTGAIKTYPAAYVWNQNRTPGAGGAGAQGIQYSNLTPAWDPFKLPPLVIEEVPPDVPAR
jgi:hypothetical protein